MTLPLHVGTPSSGMDPGCEVPHVTSAVRPSTAVHVVRPRSRTGMTCCGASSSAETSDRQLSAVDAVTAAQNTVTRVRSDDAPAPFERYNPGPRS
jgi:hypothetical protein